MVQVDHDVHQREEDLAGFNHNGEGELSAGVISWE